MILPLNRKFKNILKLIRNILNKFDSNVLKRGRSLKYSDEQK